MTLFKVISGGQNGVDQAALRVAKQQGFKTGGHLPQGAITLDGPRKDLLADYGMEEHIRSGYPPRTYENVKNADGTLRIAADFTTGGERCTLRAIQQYKKPHYDVLRPADGTVEPQVVEAVIAFLAEYNIRVLNVAGNSRRSAPAIEAYTERFLTAVFERLKDERNERRSPVDGSGEGTPSGDRNS